MAAEGVAKRLEEICAEVKQMEEKNKRLEEINKKLEEEASNLRVTNWNSEQKIQKLEKEVTYWRDIATQPK